jgi:hypothetical protein
MAAVAGESGDGGKTMMLASGTLSSSSLAMAR